MSRLDLANHIKSLRIEKAWSQQQLAGAARLSERTVQRVEHDGSCSWETLLSIASALNVDISFFTTHLSDEMNGSWNNSNRAIKLIKKFSSKSIAIAGIIFISPALYFWTAAILKEIFNFPLLFEPLQYFYSNKDTLSIFNIVSPILFIGGAILAIFINLGAIFSINLYIKKTLIKGDYILRFSALNISVIILSSALILFMLVYVAGENFALR